MSCLSESEHSVEDNRMTACHRPHWFRSAHLPCLCTISDRLCLSHKDFWVSQKGNRRYKKTRLAHFTHQIPPYTFPLCLVLDVPSNFFILSTRPRAVLTSCI